VPAPLWEVFQQDPFFVYTLIAALLLGVVSLVTGWLRLDFLVLFRARSLFHIALAVILAIVITLLSQISQTFPGPFTASATNGETAISLSVLRGLSRLPLYLIALAYGPTAGLVAAGLFAAFATTSGILGWSEAVLALELTVLGWFAMAPSPYKARWAGPLNVVLAYFLTWATGGSAYLQHLTRRGMELSTHWHYHQSVVLGVGLSALLLFFVTPKVYQKFFAGSRIAPPILTSESVVLPKSIGLQGELPPRERQRERGKLTEFPMDVRNQELKRRR
jgi:hypothetical protein